MKSFVWGARGGLLLVIGAAGLAAASQAGCGLILGTGSFQDCCEGYGAAPPSGCVACSITGSGGAASGSGGFGAGMVCAPGAKRGCYSAKEQSTEGVGPCHAGNQFCNKEGTAWGACTGEVDPKPADDCSISDDDSNCSGKHDCPCKPDDKPVACYDGDPKTEGVGTCKAGTKKCKPDGTGFEACAGQVLPQPSDDCVNLQDTNCDNKTDCMCTAGSTLACYDGPPNTQHVGTCKDGVKTCAADGSGYGTCAMEVKPNPVDMCGDGLDDNCDGTVDDLCVCQPGTTQNCYDGVPANTQGVGNCHGGTQACNGTGTAWGACTNEVIPGVEDCSVKGDENCDGIACSDAVWADLFPYAHTTADFKLFATTVDPFGNIYVSMLLNAGITLNNNLSAPKGSYLVKLDSHGVAQWILPACQFASLATDAAGNLYGAGTVSGTCNIGNTSISATGIFDTVLASLAPAGTVRWSAHYGTAGGASAGYSLSVTNAANPEVIVAGVFSSTLKLGNLAQMTATGGGDVWIGAFFGADGNPDISTSFGDKSGVGADVQSPSAVAVDSGKNVFVGGYFKTSVAVGATSALASGGQDIFVAKFSSNLKPIWLTTAGSPADDDLRSLAVDSSGAVVLAGVNRGAISFGGANIPGVAAGSMFVAKLSAVAAHQWSTGFANAAQGTNQSYVRFDSKDDLVLGGWSPNTVDLGGGGLVAGSFLGKFSNAGALKWAKAFSADRGYGLFGLNPQNDHIAYWLASTTSPVDVGLGAMAVPAANTGIVLADFQP